MQARQTIKPYQPLRYWSTVPFRHGLGDVVKYSPRRSRKIRRTHCKEQPEGLQDELIRHLKEDAKMDRDSTLQSSFSTPTR